MELKKKLLNGEHVVGTQITMINNPQLAFILKNLGFDYLFIDCEHGGFSYKEVSGLTAMCRALSMGVLVRPPQADRQNIQIYADMGIDGLIIPMVESADTMKDVVSYARYAPLGVRGVAQGPVTDFRGVSDIRDLLKEVNEEFLIIAQIESKQGVENCDEILSVPGVDAVFFGMMDLSVSYGKPGKVEDPVLKDKVKKVIACAKEHNIICGYHFFGRHDLSWGLEHGIQLISWRSDISAMQSSYKSDLSFIKNQL
ncbi:MAG: aldolase/citrate lyase family protein [Lachnospiraceae bacterium]|nr:aldolase/citrate lyase family protein [Lachnospiraceae bacterium]